MWHRKLFIALASFLVLVSVVLAQHDEWNELNRQVVKLQREGKYAEATKVAEKSLEMAEKTFGPDNANVAASLNTLAELYRSQKIYSTAEALYERSLTIYEKALGPDHPEVATSLNNLADLCRLQRRYAEAEPLYKRSLAIYEKAFGQDHPAVASSLSNLARMYKQMANEKEAPECEECPQRIERPKQGP